MLGGGFLKQGADTARYNRSLLGKEGHKPFERKEDRIRERIQFDHDKKMSVQLRYLIQKENESLERKEIRSKIIVCIVTVALLITFLTLII